MENVPTMREALDTYLTERNDLAPRTVDFYEDAVRNGLSPIADVPVDAITRQQVRRLHAEITRASGPASANACMRVAKLLYRDVEREFDLPPNPVSRGVRMHRSSPPKDALDDAGIAAFWLALDGVTDPVRRTAWLFTALTGWRRQEVAQCRWRDFDGDAGTMVNWNPKGGERRAYTAGLGRLATRAVANLRKVTGEGDWVFAAPTATGHITGLRSCRTMPYRPHQLRRTWRSVAARVGVSLETACACLNHSSTGGSEAISFRYLSMDHLVDQMAVANDDVAEYLLRFR